MKNYLTAFTVSSARTEKSLSGEPAKPTKGDLGSSSIFGKLPDCKPAKPTEVPPSAPLGFEKTSVVEPSKPTIAASVGFEGQGIGLFSNLVSLLEGASSLCVVQGAQPYLTEGNELIIPPFAPQRFRWWQNGQSVWVTLAGLNAPLATWRRHGVNLGEFLLSAEHSEWCGGSVQAGTEFVFCVKCGGYCVN